MVLLTNKNSASVLSLQFRSNNMKNNLKNNNKFNQINQFKCQIPPKFHKSKVKFNLMNCVSKRLINLIQLKKKLMMSSLTNKCWKMMLIFENANAIGKIKMNQILSKCRQMPVLPKGLTKNLCFLSMKSMDLISLKIERSRSKYKFSSSKSIPVKRLSNKLLRK